MRTTWRDGTRIRTVELSPSGTGRYRVVVDDVELEVSVEPLTDGRLRLTTPAGVHVAEVTAVGARRFVRLGTMDFVVDREEGRGRRPGTAQGGLEAPMPGVVTRVMAAVGETVEKGQPLVALEAMKMEHVIRAPRAGVIRSIAARPGEMVPGGVTLVELED
jgi:biotin carboxyl carrier protein